MLVIVVFLALSGGLVAAHQIGRLYPAYAVFVLVAVLAIGFAIVRTDSVPVTVVLSLVIALGVSVRTFVFSFPTGMIGADGDSLAVVVTQMAGGGSTEIIPGYFYQEASSYFLYSGTSTLLGDVSSRWGLAIHPLVMGAVVPLGIFAIGRRTRLGTRGSLAAATFVAVAPSGVKRGFHPVPEAFAVSLFVVGLYLIIRSLHRPRVRTLGLLVVVLLALSLTHKIVVFITFLVVGGAFLLKKVQHPRLSLDAKLVGIVIVVGLFLYIQWIVLTPFFEGALLQILGAFQALIEFVGGGITPVGEGIEQVSATGGLKGGDDTHVLSAGVERGVELALQPLPYRVLYNVGYGVVAGSVAGFPWFYLFLKRRTDSPAQVLLSGSAVTVVITAVFLLFSSKHGPARMLIYAELFFGLLFGVMIAAVSVQASDVSWKHTGVRYAVVGLFLFVLVAQVMTPGYYPDAPDKTRKYLTEAEISGKQFGANYATKRISASPYFSGETTPPFTEQNEARQEAIFRDMGSELRFGKIPVRSNPFVAYRPSVEVYKIGGSSVLTWDPAALLDRHYDRVYDNGEVTIYHYPDQ